MNNKPHITAAEVIAATEATAEATGVKVGLAIRDACEAGEAKGIKAGLAIRDTVGGVGSFFGGLVAGIRGPNHAINKQREEERDARVVAILIARRGS